MVSYLFDDIFSNAIEQHKVILEAIKEGSVQDVLNLERKHISKLDMETAGYRRAYPQFFK
jgi:DNA-binding GntR family transcriptional regulator